MSAAGCGTTTNTEPEDKQNNTADSAVGNSDAANKIYRDSGDINSATQPGGGTANPAANDTMPHKK